MSDLSVSAGMEIMLYTCILEAVGKIFWLLQNRIFAEQIQRDAGTLIPCPIKVKDRFFAGDFMGTEMVIRLPNRHEVK